MSLRYRTQRIETSTVNKEQKTMTRHLRSLAVLAALTLAALGLAASPAFAAAAPQWSLESRANTTAQSGGSITYYLIVKNSGDADADGGAEPIELRGELPAGLTIESVNEEFSGFSCAVPGSQSLSCLDSEVIPPFVKPNVVTVKAAVSPAMPEPTVLSATWELSGGGAPTVSTVDPTTISAAAPSFGIDAFDISLRDDGGGDFGRAGGHPSVFRTMLDANTTKHGLGFPADLKGDLYPVEPGRDIVVELPPGFFGNPGAAATCSAAQLANGQSAESLPLCPTASQVGVATFAFSAAGPFTARGPLPVFNMEPPSGAPARFGINVFGTVVVLDGKLRSHSDYGVSIFARNVSQGLPFSGSIVDIWNDPSDPSHDAVRACPGEPAPGLDGPSCPATESAAFLRLPTACSTALPFALHTDSWPNQGRFDANGEPDLSDAAWKSRSILNHRAPGYPANPQDPTTPWGKSQALTGCDEVPVKGELSVRATALETETSSGLEVHVEIPNPGLENPEGIASSDVKDVTVALPQGVTINPSQAEGLGVCAPAQYESSELSFHPDGQHGCPSDSKIGTVEVHTQLLEETIPGNVYVAKPYDNPFDSLLALYIVLEEPERGILVKLPGVIRLNETTGRIEAEFDDLPQVPFETFDFKFREGARAPLVTPSTCGTYTTETEIEGWSDPGNPITSTSTFQITKGIGGAPCPPEGTPGFKPTFSAGSINNNAGSFSPFNMRLTRNDGEQDTTRFSTVLPPGVLAKLAGLSQCPGSAIAAAKAKTGLQEIAAPSCPASSEIGRSLAGAGVGSVLTHVPGKIYLGGPFHGDPLSVIAITPAVAGPFDVGTVVVHEALTLNPKTAEVEVDGSASDPIPHILKGIPLKLRALRVYVDRPDFTLNPTSCDPSSTKATLFGGGGDVFSTLDDVPVSLSDRYQAASCAALGLKPRLKLRLTARRSARGAFPRLRAEYLPRRGDTNISRLSAILPNSELLENSHFRTICTRAQFVAGASLGSGCPRGSVYGHVKAWTPLLDEPLQGPVYLRSSSHELPDLALALHGLVDIEAVARIDSVRGRIRSTFEGIPDAPLSRVVLEMRGGEKGLLVNSTDICRGKRHAKVRITGQNGKVSGLKPRVTANCRGA